jgi:Predicted glycosyltransferases
VVILTYNNLCYLEKAVKSVFIQNYKNIEVIINDDASKDFDYNKVEKLFENSPKNIKNVTINSNKFNLGTVKNFNNAIKTSKGSIIIPLACDDEFSDPNVINKIKEFFEKNDCLICTAKRILIDEDGKEKSILPSAEDIKYLNSKSDVLFKRMYISNIISGACTYYKKDIFEKYGLFNEKFILLEDYPYYMNVLIKNGQIHFLDYVTIRYRSGGVSSKKVKGTIIYEDFKKVYEIIIFPQKKSIGTKKYRTTKLDYYRKYYKDDKKRYIIAHFVYLDVVLCKFIRRKILKNISIIC